MYVDNLINDFPKGLMDLSLDEAETFIDTEVEEQLENLSHDDFDDWLDELGEPCKVGTLEYSQSQVLKQCDPIAYRVCFSDDYCESMRDEIEDQGRDLVRAELEAHENYVLS